MKRIIITSILSLAVVFNMFSARARRLPSQEILKRTPIEILHEWALGYRTIKYTIHTANESQSGTRTKKVSVNFPLRITAIKELMRRKDPKSIETLSLLTVEGLATRYSPRGLQGPGREGLSAQGQINIRLMALRALKNFKGVTLDENQKGILGNSLRTVVLEEFDERVRALGCVNMGIHKDAFKKNEKEFFLEYFRREVLRVVRARHFKVLLGMFYAAREFNLKEGEKFIDRAIRSGLRGWLLRQALKVKNKLASGQ